MLRISFIDPQTYTIALESIILEWLIPACRHSDNITAESVLEASKGTLCRILVCHNDKDELRAVFAYEYLPETQEMVQLSTTYNGLTKDEIQELMRMIADKFRAMGIKRLLGIGRKGWKRVAPTLGWTLVDGVYEYNLKEKQE